MNLLSLTPPVFTLDVLKQRWILNIWRADNNHRVYLFCDSNKFYAEILAGDAETYLTVGYSCPNGALRVSDDICDAVKMIADSLDAYWNSEDRQKDFDDMLPVLYEMAMIANSSYNDYLGNA